MKYTSSAELETKKMFEKKETVDEAAKKYEDNMSTIFNAHELIIASDAFIAGATWQSNNQ